ncbi:hypothetical protein [Embleya sp. NPDC005971]|uniref:hypothetical protein n=1 Tax=Embleya sp. NPDC005971 TaxID=3156724 RepID=UPI0033C5DE00
MAGTVPDGRPVAVTGSDDRTVRVWDPTAGRRLGEPLTGRVGPVNASTLHGRSVAVTGSDDGSVRGRDPTTGRCIDRIRLPAQCRALGMVGGGRLLVGFDPDVVLLVHGSGASPTGPAATGRTTGIDEEES